MMSFKLIYRLANLANPIYKLAVSIVLLYSLYYKHKQLKADHERITKYSQDRIDQRQRDNFP